MGRCGTVAAISATRAARGAYRSDGRSRRLRCYAVRWRSTRTARRTAEEPRGNVTLRENAIELRDLSLTFPAAAAPRTLTDATPVELGGDIVVVAPELRHDMSGSGNGALDVRWERARLAWNEATLDMGTVSAHLVPRGRDLAGPVTNTGGTARVDGDIALAPDSATVRLTITPGPAAPPAIASAIAALGTPDPNGGVRLQWHGGAR